jgi:hypothetical protein
MTYTYINSKYLIPEIYSYFNVQSSEWENRFPYWIADAMNGMSVYTAYTEASQEVDVVEWMAKIPAICKRIRSIFAEHCKLEFNDLGYEGRFLQPCEYSLNGGYVNVPFENGKITIFMDALPIEEDCETGIFYPLIPDVEELKIALRLYVMKNILMRGYKHPVLDLNANNEYTNPALAFDKQKRKAIIACGTLNMDARTRISEAVLQFYKKDRKIYRPQFNNLK